METKKIAQLIDIDFHDSHTTKIDFNDYKFTLEFDYICSESEKESSNRNKKCQLTLVLSKVYLSDAIDDAVCLIQTKNRKLKLEKFLKYYSLFDFVKYLKENDGNLQIYNIYFKPSGCMILAELMLQGKWIAGNWIAIELKIEEVYYKWLS